ncbi:MAG: tetratricopeptide repeat protein, partial [Candidatus Aminicenantes bacterium]|nr:tetratricopeptide repeat protein [Candidatus Aminicenantes bacterium]
MRNRTYRPLGLIALIGILFLAVPGLAQYREYYLYGKVLDTQKNPVEGVQIDLRDEVTSRSYNMKTKKGGEFKFAGLPHGVYQVIFSKEGFATKQDEWRFETPQDTMQKVEIPAVILVSQSQAEEVQRLKEVEAGIKESADMIRQGDLDGAIAQLKGMLDKNPKDANALYLIGMAYSKKRMFPEATGAFLQVAEMAPKFAAAFHQLGVCYQQQDQPDMALEAYKKALELDPSNTDAFYNSALVLFKQSRVDEALERFEKALVLKPDDPAFLEMAGRCYINKADYPKAIEYLEKAKTGYNDPERTKFLDELIAML